MTVKQRLADLLSVVVLIPFAPRVLRAVPYYSDVLIRVRAARELRRKLPPRPRVMHGPFAGMAYGTLDSHAGSWPMEIFGTYESELHEVIEEACRHGYDYLLNIGSGDGYYAVGLAMRMPAAVIEAFDADPAGHAICRARARANGVDDRINFHGVCTIEALTRLTKGRSGLIVCDCEGCELDLLAPERIPDLAQFDLLIELHDHATDGPTVSQLMARRFAGTHAVEIINMRQQRPVGRIAPEYAGSLEFCTLVAETGRGASVGWAWMKSRRRRDVASHSLDAQLSSRQSQ